MTHFQKCNLRVKIITAAQKTGLVTAYQFAKRCETLGIPYSTAYGYHVGKHDMTGAKLDILLKHFKLKIK